MRSNRRVHFVGIGGIGMSGLAHALLARGDRVTGSDIARTPTIERLISRGATVHLGHQGALVRGADLIVYSSSITPQNPELTAARNLGIPVVSRAQVLAACMAGKWGVAVTGTHGKTTTTALVATLLLAAGEEPTVFVGGDVSPLGGNARLGTGRTVVVEADESDGSFVYLTPRIAVITNIEEEHLDYYRNLGEILQAYQQFLERVPPDGLAIGCGDDPGVRRLLHGDRPRVLTYGLDASCDLTAQVSRLAGRQVAFEARLKGRRLGKLTLQIPGLHNVVNSLAALGVGLELGLGFSVIRRALASYPGADRRFQLHGEVDGILVVEDYAHHPTEIAATLQAARTWGCHRVFCVFQPHRFSRTKYLRDQFGLCFAAADFVIVTDVYAASEDPIEGVGMDSLCQAVRSTGFEAIEGLPCCAIVPRLLTEVRSGDLVLILGAGDVGRVAVDLVEALQQRRAQPLEMAAC